MIRKIAILFYMLSALLLAADKNTELNPCELLTKQEVEKVLGTKMQGSRLITSGTIFGTVSCKYLSVDLFEKSASATFTIGTTAYMKANDAVFESAKEKYEKEKNAYLGALKRRNEADTFEEIKGLGDEAYWGTVALHILKGDTFLKIKIKASAGMSAKSSQEMEKMVKERNFSVSKEIAKIVLPKLRQ